MTTQTKKLLNLKYALIISALLVNAGCATTQDMESMSTSLQALKAEMKAEIAAANSNATSAVDTASKAQSAADSATKQASQAVDTASKAQSAADSATKQASQAVSKAESAIKTANEAQKTSTETQKLASQMSDSMNSAVAAAKVAEHKSYEAVSAAEDAKAAANTSQSKALEAQAKALEALSVASEGKSVSYNLKSELTAAGMVRSEIKDPSTLAPEKKALASEESFDIRIGSYVSSKEANLVKSRLESGGHNTVIEKETKGDTTFHIVKIGPYNDRLIATRIYNRAIAQGYNANLINNTK